MLKIIVLPLYGIGDVLMTTPALRNLKEQASARITYLHMFRATKDILENNPFVNENIHFPFLEKNKLASIKFLGKLRNKFDCSINFFPSNRKDYNIAAFIIGAPMRIGCKYNFCSTAEMNFLNTHTLLEDKSLHCVEKNLDLLNFLGIQKANSYPLEIYLTEQEVLSAKNWLKENKIEGKIVIGVHAGSSLFKNHIYRRWPPAAFIELINKLSLELKDSVFLLFGGDEEKSLKELIRAKAEFKERVFLTDFSGIRNSAALIQNCKLFISNDSGLMHLAAALKVPTVAIFGPTNPVWVRPWQAECRIFKPDLSCSPCFSYSPKPLRCLVRKKYSCTSDIKVDSVFKASVDLLNFYFSRMN